MWQDCARLLINPYFVAIASPSFILILGALGKSTIRRDFSYKSWFLGFDAALTALYAGVVYLYDMTRDSSLLTTRKVTITAGFLLWSFVIFFVVIGCHMFWEAADKDHRPVARFLILGVLANLLGFGLLLAFVLLVKGV